MRRLQRLERRSAPRRWCVVEVGYGWQGDVRAALGLELGEDDVLVVRTRFGEPAMPPRLVSLAPAPCPGRPAGTGRRRAGVWGTTAT
jgi:hypothetical protein